ncbi:MAG: spermidine/putrescine ABC transporter substrate-binding protein [Spirochaetaceae bacterium]|jgi:spermidine/putrescine-binding protein|nr:spermidine/putrescine ABC transporter substrate-binding protein [Spirochaetaceae bacterium]
MRKMALLTLLLLSALFAGCGNSRSGKVFTLYTWEGMFPDEILAGFEKETGYRVNYINFDLDETMLTKLQAAKGGDYDLVIADDYIIEVAIAEGLVQKLDKGKIPGFRNINPVCQGVFYDPRDEYTVPYGAGVQTIVYDPARVNLNITGYADLWNSSLRNSIGITANYRVIDGIPLKIMGSSYNSENAAEIRRAGQMLLDLAPNIRLIKDDNLQDDLLSGEISVGVMYTSQVTMAMMENPALKVVYPKEGIGYGLMAGFVPVNAPNSAAAHAFLNYILDPERGAACFEYLGYYSTFSASDEYISPEYRAFLTLPLEYTTNMEMMHNVSDEAEEAHNLICTAYREATGGAGN